MANKSLLTLMFMAATFLLMSCKDKEKVKAGICPLTQYNQVLFQYESGTGRLQTVSSKEGIFSFSYDASGRPASIRSQAAVHPVKTDKAGNIIQTMGYRFQYDNKNRLVLMERIDGDLAAYRRFAYDAGGNLSGIYIKTQDMFAMDGPPAIRESLSIGKFVYDASTPPWQRDRVLQWLAATSLLVPFEIVDQANAYSRRNLTAYSIFYAADTQNPRFTSSVAYLYGDNRWPVGYEVSGNAGAFGCTFGYGCGNAQARD